MASRLLFVAGGLLVVLGLIMIPLPGPGYLIVSLGLFVLVVGLVVSAAEPRRGDARSRAWRRTTHRRG